MRFIAEDAGEGSLIEAAVDDWSVVAYDNVVAVGPNLGARALALAPARPNPSRGEATLTFALPAAGRATLELFDVRGRRVRVLLDGERAAGEQTVTWDGRDGTGREVGSGVYVARLTTAAGVAQRNLVRVR
jgi:hypothetical protein